MTIEIDDEGFGKENLELLTLHDEVTFNLHQRTVVKAFMASGELADETEALRLTKVLFAGFGALALAREQELRIKEEKAARALITRIDGRKAALIVENRLRKRSSPTPL